MANTWSNIWSWLSGSSRRVPGVQSLEPGSGRMTTRSITPDTAMQLSAVFACVRLLAETIASLPLNFYEVSAGGKRTQIFDHPLHNLLSTKPNRYQTKNEFFETLVYQLALHGNAYHRINRNSSREIFSLMPLMTPQVETVLQDDGNILHRYQTGRNTEIFKEDLIWHNKLFGNGIVGMSPLGFARNSLGIAISAEDRVNVMANNGFKPSGVLSIDKVLKPEQRKAIRENFNDLTEGGNDSLRVLEAGMQYTVVSMNPKDVQLLETRRFQIEDIARFFGVPSVLINDTQSTTVWGSGIEQIVAGFYILGLRPYIERFESGILIWLLNVDERRKIVPEFDLDMLLRGNEKSRYESYQTAIRNSVKTPNECRLREGLSPKEGGDQLFMQQQLVPLTDINKGRAIK